MKIREDPLRREYDIELPEHKGPIPQDTLREYAPGRRELAERMAALGIRGELPPLVFPASHVPGETEILGVLAYQRNLPSYNFHRHYLGKPADVVLTLDEEAGYWDVVQGSFGAKWGVKELGHAAYRLAGEKPEKTLYVVYVPKGEGARIQESLRPAGESAQR